MSDVKRAPARALAQQYLAQGDATGWFEALYAQAGNDAGAVPWADLAANPALLQRMSSRRVDGTGRRALKIGCGLGDDAEALAQCGFAVTAFDVSPTAIAWCRERFPGSPVDYQVADLLAPPENFRGHFDFVLEAYTVQVLPQALRAEAIARVASFVAPGGTLLVIARMREDGDPPGEMPWPLTRGEVASFASHGLRASALEVYLDDETPPVRRFLASFTRD